MNVSAACFRLTILCFVMLTLGFNDRAWAQHAATAQKETYQCLSCGNDCDSVTHGGPGTCAQCKMELVKKSTVTHKTIEPSSICNYIKNHPEVVLLDVRTKEEFEGKSNPDFGTLQNAINIPVQELEKRLSEIAYLKGKEIIVYCSRSHRSPRAAYLLTSSGFANITNMAGGMSTMKDDNCKK